MSVLTKFHKDSYSASEDMTVLLKCQRLELSPGICVLYLGEDLK